MFNYDTMIQIMGQDDKAKKKDPKCHASDIHVGFEP